MFPTQSPVLRHDQECGSWWWSLMIPIVPFSVHCRPSRLIKPFKPAHCSRIRAQQKPASLWFVYKVKELQPASLVCPATGKLPLAILLQKQPYVYAMTDTLSSSPTHSEIGKTFYVSARKEKDLYAICRIERCLVWLAVTGSSGTPVCPAQARQCVHKNANNCVRGVTRKIIITRSTIPANKRRVRARVKAAISCTEGYHLTPR